MLKARLLGKRWRKAQQMSEAILAATLQNTEPADLLVSSGPHPVLEVLSGTRVAEVEPKPGKASKEPPQTRVVVAGNEAVAGIAAGLASALKSASSGALVITIVPSSVTRGAAWEQTTEFAAANRLPIIFVSDGTSARPTRRHDGSDLSHWPFPTIAVDGRDVIAVYRVTKEAMAAARRGHGPTLVDCVNFVAPGGRGKDERDPLASFRGYLKRHHAWQEDWAKGLESTLVREIGGK
jgi:TPP-dependent pyruvate/acetoin dehydrogenase alpha subunit